MKIESIGIIGGTNGLGARLAEHWRHRFPEIEILIAGRSTETTNKKIVQKCDLVLFAVPIQATDSVIASLIRESRSDQIWSDITSVKQGPVQAMLASKAEVCGLHPLFGPLPSIVRQPLVYCPARIQPDSLTALLALLSDFDCLEMTPAEHDDTMGVVQCVSHLSDLVMGETLRTSGLGFETIWRVSSPSYRLKLQLMGRMFAQNPELYIDIATLNQSAEKFDDQFQQNLSSLKNQIEKGDREILIKKFDQIRNYLTPEFCDQAYLASQGFMSGSSAGREEETPKSGHLAVFGEQYSHTDGAAQSFYPDERPGYFSTIEDLFAAVAAGRFRAGIVPYENSNHGSVLATLEGLFDFPEIQIVASRSQRIDQHLLGLPGAEISDIKVISSHPQALAQSKNWLADNCPQAQKIQSASTALAARALVQAQDLHRAVIGGEALARSLGLQILARNLQPAENKTRFVEIQKSPSLASDNVYLSFVFWFGNDQAGNLAAVLQFMATSGINLVKLDSRRTSQKYGDYLFFVDAAVSGKRFATLESDFAKLVAGYRILGSFDD